LFTVPSSGLRKTVELPIQKDGAPIFYPMFRHPGTLSVELLATGIGAMYNEQVFVPSPDGIKPEKRQMRIY
jgi:hypothetical protein